MEYGRVTDREIEAIRRMVGPERLSTGESILDLHSKDEPFHQRREPDSVVWPLSAQEISQILKLADAKRIPVNPWGAGTSLEGNPIPGEEGIVLDLQQMNHILELKTEDLQVRVEAGVIYKELNQYRGAWHWDWKEEVYEEGAWRKPYLDETDQETFGSQWNHEPRKDL